MRKYLIMLLFCSGCAASQLGIRPQEPSFPLVGNDPCQNFLIYVSYVQQLEDSYYARSNINRGGSYASGAVAAGAIAGTTGLTIGDSPTTATLGLISVTQGFLAAMFNMINNENLAFVYTEASNGLATALDNSFATMMTTNNPESCIRAHLMLRHLVTGARNNLELARTDSSNGALQRALSQQRHYSEIISQFPQTVPSQRASTLAPQEPSRLDAILERLDQRLQSLEHRP